MKKAIRFIEVVLIATAAHTITVCNALSSSTGAAKNIPSLSDDYAAAQQRKALQEEILLNRPGGDVELPCYDDSASSTAATTAAIRDKDIKKNKRRSRNRATGGAGFGVAATNKSSSLALKPATHAQKLAASAMAAAIRRDGVIRLPSLLSESSCYAIRDHVLNLKEDVFRLYTESNNDQTMFDPTDYYGVEPGRTCRTDLLLPLDSAVQGTLSELLASSSPLRHLFCELLPLSAPLYEIAAVVTTPGSHRQTIHPDLPFKDDCPLYVVFVALQDVTKDMGPTTFLRGTQNAPPPHDLDEILAEADAVISTLKAGDAVVFDARILHCGNANTSSTARALFNFSFRRPDSGVLGYEGSIRKGYIGKTTLGELLQVADNLNGWGVSGGKTLESVYGNGLLAS